MKTLTQVETSNDLRHTITTSDAEGNDLIIEIRLNDECKNGHQDFAITGSGYLKGRRGDRANIYGGCCHDEILKACPELKIFVNLHLADYTGCPMYAVANGFYHLTVGFNNTKPNDEGFKAEFCEYYRLSPEQFDILALSENETRFAINLINLGILNQWQAEANQAVKMLEEWTGKKFLVDSVKTQFEAPTPEQIETEAQREKEGYYLPEAIKQREAEQGAEIFKAKSAEIDAKKDKAIKAINLETESLRAVLKAGMKFYNNFIFYSHTLQGCFNWKGYEPQITEQEFNAFLKDCEKNKELAGMTWILKEEK